MNGIVEVVIALVVGLALGYVIGDRLGNKRAGTRAGTDATTEGGDKEWWKLRGSLTGTQLQILQYVESKRAVAITALHEKFSFIPDRELYYRLEQIVLMGFIQRGRKQGQVVYNLNEEYAGCVEQDKTVILPEE